GEDLKLRKGKKGAAEAGDVRETHIPPGQEALAPGKSIEQPATYHLPHLIRPAGYLNGLGAVISMDLLANRLWRLLVPAYPSLLQKETARPARPQRSPGRL